MTAKIKNIMKDRSIFIRICSRLPIRVTNIKLRIIVALTILFTTFSSGYSQEIEEEIHIGPYKLIYRGEADYDIIAPDSMQLKNFFKLKADTVTVTQYVEIEKKEVYKNAMQLNMYAGLSNTFGVSGYWKQQISGIFFLNAGLSLGIFGGEFSNDDKNNPYSRKDKMLEIGVPISVELAKPYTNKASLYAGIGFTPAFYSTMSVDEKCAETIKNKGEKDYGFLVSPRIDFGGNIPLFNKVLRLGVYGEYRICCFQSVNIYRKRVSKSLVGVNVGLIF